jgi:hypothetical protein
MVESSSDGLVLAGINGAILSIFIAVTSGYFLIYFQKLDDMKTELIDKANRINAMSYNRFYRAGLEDLSGANPVEVLIALSHGGFGALTGVITDETNEGERAKILPEMISRLARSYPFPVAEESAMGATGLDLSSEREVKTWLVDFVSVDLIRAVELETGRIDRYRDRLPSRRKLILGGLVIILVFTCGVSLPMVWSDPPPAIAAWIPVSIYSTALATGVVGLWRLLSA